MCQCKVCKVSKVRLVGEARKDGRGTSKVDEKGRHWNGYTCPDCRNANTYGESGDQNLGPAEPLFQPKMRPCRSCSRLNANYYKCEPCRAQDLEQWAGSLDEDMFAFHSGANAGANTGSKRNAGFRF
jgi:hypothetical protein